MLKPQSLLLILSLGAAPAIAQEIPEAELAAAKAKAAEEAKAAAAKEAAKAAPAAVPAVAAPAVSNSGSWWSKRSAAGRSMIGGGAVSAILGVGLAAYGASSANNAIDRRKQLQSQPFMTPEQRSDFTAQSDTVKLGRTLHLSGLVFLGGGGLVLAIGGLI